MSRRPKNWRIIERQMRSITVFSFMLTPNKAIYVVATWWFYAMQVWCDEWMISTLLGSKNFGQFHNYMHTNLCKPICFAGRLVSIVIKIINNPTGKLLWSCGILRLGKTKGGWTKSFVVLHLIGIIITHTKEYNILYYIILMVHSFSLRKQPN